MIRLIQHFFFFLVFAAFLGSCQIQSPSRKPRPISISYRKYKQIQNRRYKNREAPRYDHRHVKWALINDVKNRKYVSMETRRYMVNVNSRNRKMQKKMVAKKNRRDRNYQYYKDAMINGGDSEKSNFSIYDR